MPAKQTDRAVALVFVITRKCRVSARLGRQARCGRRNRLNARLLIIRDDRLAPPVAREPVADSRVPGFIESAIASRPQKVPAANIGNIGLIRFAPN